ncbi:Receptor-like serine/threonine-protein kinase SD1-8 [Platanthera zijinensis]|uniref:Receptor-like serine/threonine-protein kinase n=1 Tax=Platanthera zijinensis TaxID=2320716 RepID=A0AAP0BXN7_9ASPA
MAMMPIRNYELIILFILLSATVSNAAATSGDRLNISRPLYDGETLISAGGAFELGFFNPDSNSSKRYVGIWYHNAHEVVWVANARNPVAGFSGSLTLTPNGTLVIVDRKNSTDVIIWFSSGPSKSIATATTPIAQLLETGNLVVKSDADAADDETVVYIWQSFDYPSNTILPGMHLGWDLRTGLNRNITSWATLTDPFPGIYTFAIKLGGVPQLIETDGQSLYWRGGPWVGNGFAGTQQGSAYQAFITTSLVMSKEEVAYFFEVNQGFARITIFPDGTTQRLRWQDPPGKWSFFWKTPTDQCDAFSPCGPFGICNADLTPFCSCLPGFRPKNPDRWALTDVSDGCVRNTTLDCSRSGTKGADGFVPMNGVKLPDTSAAVGDLGLGLDDCRVKCSMNCSCTAYSVTNITDGGSGCILWAGELIDIRLLPQSGRDLYVRVAAADLAKIIGSSQSDHKGKRGVATVLPILGSILVGFILISGLIICHYKRKKKIITFHGENGEVISDGNGFDLPLFDFETIADATNNFSVDNRLGEGGFGPVYKGRKKDGSEIAVKRLSKSSMQGISEFKNEIMLIGKLQHRNLVRLLGCCIERQERMLIYEYMPNKSLDTFLFDKTKTKLLNWDMRYRIIVGIARGLLYLHQDSVVRIIHRDLKASNILLDLEMVPKISDFGLARIFAGDEAKSKTKIIAGTYGYMSPEYLMDGFFSAKSDVYSFGVLVLEVLSNQRNSSWQSNNHLVEHAWRLWEEGRALELVDGLTSDSFSIIEVFRCIKVAFLCVQQFPDERPFMSSVILMLTSDKELPEPKCPGFVPCRRHFEVQHSSSENKELGSLNKITLTLPHGR